MNTYTKNECINLLLDNNINQPKAKYSNNVLLAMLECVPADTTFRVEPTRGGFELNRGSLCEAIIKAVLYGYDSVGKTSQNKSDLCKGIKNATAYGLKSNYCYEIKFATVFAPATLNATKTKSILLVTATGVYLVNKVEHCGRFTNNSDLDGERLDYLSEVLGFQPSTILSFTTSP